MAVVRGNTNSTSGNTDVNGTISFTLNIAAGSNKEVLVYVFAGFTTNPASVTVGGVSATLVEKTNNGSRTVWTYRAEMGSTTGNQSVVVDWASSQTSVIIGATDFSNVNQSSPIDAQNEGTGTIAASGNVSLSATATKADGYVIGVINADPIGSTIGPNASETELFDIESASTGGQAQGKDSSGVGSNSTSWLNNDGVSGKAYAAHVIILSIASINTNDERSAKITGVYAQKQSQSLAVAEPETPITKAVLMPDTTEPDDSSIDWYLSADGGSHWEAVTPNEEHAFTNTGTDLRWRAIHNPSTDGFDFPTIQKVVISWELGVSVNDERNAKLTGQATANAERSAKITGQATANSERNAKTTGTATANSERNAKITGQDTANSERSAKITGASSVDTNDERSAKITGTATANSERSAKMTALEGSSSERNAKIHGTAEIDSERSTKITGTLDDDDERSAKLTGQATANAERNAKIIGQDTASSERNAKITGTATANSERNAKTTGQDTASSERSAKLTGTSSVDTNSERSAKITGTATANSERSAKMTALEGSSSERSAKIHGTDEIDSERSAKITGTATDDDERSAKLTGQATANAERSARLIGGVSEDRAVKIYAGFLNTVSDTFDTTDNKDAVNTTALWEGDGEITLG